MLPLEFPIYTTSLQFACLVEKVHLLPSILGLRCSAKSVDVAKFVIICNLYKHQLKVIDNIL